MMSDLYYQDVRKYKYRVHKLCEFETNITGYDIEHQYFCLYPNGKLFINPEYLWDGCSGPTWDTKNTMKAGLGHDALYQMIRLRLIPLREKEKIDLWFKHRLLKDGVWSFRADYYHWGVDKFGHSSCIPGDVKIPEVQVIF